MQKRKSSSTAGRTVSSTSPSRAISPRSPRGRSASTSPLASKAPTPKTETHVEPPAIVYDPAREKYESDILNIRKIIPNGFTLLGTVIGISAVRYALGGQYVNAVYATTIAAFVDGLDGPVARALHGTSQFGAELDSLNDFVCFGVAPAIVLYLWLLNTLGWQGWLSAIVFTLAMQARLARFNAGVDFNTKPWTKNYFMGVPAPAGAGLALMPIVLSTLFPPGWKVLGLIDPNNATHVSYYLFVVSALCVSRLPTFSSKMIKRTMFKGVVRKAVAAIPVCVFTYGLIYHTFATLSTICALYFVSIPICYATFHIEDAKMRKVLAAGGAIPAYH